MDHTGTVTIVNKTSAAVVFDFQCETGKVQNGAGTAAANSNTGFKLAGQSGNIFAGISGMLTFKGRDGDIMFVYISNPLAGSAKCYAARTYDEARQNASDSSAVTYNEYTFMTSVSSPSRTDKSFTIEIRTVEGLM